MINFDDYGRIGDRLRAVELDLRNYLLDPSDYTCEYFQDVHTAVEECLGFLGIPTIEKEEDDEISELDND